MSASPKPVTILTGFLGAGKTTYLNHLLTQQPNTRYAIIENEFGEQGIDGELVVRPEETIVELNNGCLCCTLNDNLYDILNDLFERRADFDEIIIEATGIADPTGLAEPFIVHPLIKEQFPLRGVICLVDAEHIEDQLVETEEAKNQVAFSDVLLINKSDLVGPEYVAALAARLQHMNALARVAVGNRDAFPMVELGAEQSPLNELFPRPAASAEAENNQQFPVSKPHGRHHHHHHHTEAIASHTFEFDQPFEFKTLNMQLFAYLMLASKGLYRLKGIVWLADSDKQHIVQSVGKRFGIEEGATWPEGKPKRSVLVFIGKNLQLPAIEALLNECLSTQDAIEQ